jgi:hypothetical protein
VLATLTLTAALLPACASPTSEGGAASATDVASRGAGSSDTRVAGSNGPVAPAPSASAKLAQEAAAARYADLVNDLSEPDTYFFSDNLVTNETSYLQVAEDVAGRADPSGVYVGVGPEQNFSYIALARPHLAFIVDIRRPNMLLHVLYRAAFEESTSRAHFLALLLGREHDTSKTNAATDGIDAIIASATQGAATNESYAKAHGKLMDRVAKYGVTLDDRDLKMLDKMHRSFFTDQLALRFELHEKNGRTYPTLSEILKTNSPSGQTGSFLASEESFRFVQDLERSGRVVPIVGDFAGDKALPQLASFLESENRRVSFFYVSNVEQYLLEPKVWKKWVRNVNALPKTNESVFVRAYLDQGRRHPLQMTGHRTATVLSRMVDFEGTFGEKATTTFWALSTEKLVAQNAK